MLTLYSIVLQDYSTVSTIAGFHFIFEPNLSCQHKCFWITILVLATLLSFYWSFVLFIDWQANPAQTTVVTSALDIKEVPFPSVTICHNGYYHEGLVNKLKEEYYFYIKNICIVELFGVCFLLFEIMCLKRLEVKSYGSKQV